MKVLILAELFLAFVCLQLQYSESKEPYSYWTPKTTNTRLYHPTQNVKDAGVRRRIQSNNENHNTLYQYPEYQSQPRYEHEYPTESYQEQYQPVEKASDESLLGKITQFFRNGMRKLRTISVRNMVGDWANSNLDRQGIPSFSPLAAFVAFTTAVGLGGIAAQTGIVNQMNDVINNILNPYDTTTTDASDALDQVVQAVIHLGEIEGRSFRQARQAPPAFGTLEHFNLNKAKYLRAISKAYSHDITLINIELSPNSLTEITVTFRIKYTTGKTKLLEKMANEDTLISVLNSQLASIGAAVGSNGISNGAVTDVVATCNNGVKDSDEGGVDCGGQCGIFCGACQDDTCSNRGTCTTITYDNIQVSACECDSPWYGPYCHEHACAGQTCSGVGTCSAAPFDDCEAGICQRIVNNVNNVNEPNAYPIGAIDKDYQACMQYIDDGGEDIYDTGNYIVVPVGSENYVTYLENCAVGTVNEQEYSMSINGSGFSVTVFRNYGQDSVGITGELGADSDGRSVQGTNEYNGWKGFWKITSECFPKTGDDCNGDDPTLHHLWVTDAPITSDDHIISDDTGDDGDILDMVNGHNVVYVMWATQAGYSSSEAVMLELVKSVANSFGSCEVSGYACSCNAGYTGNDCEYGPCDVNNGGCEQTCTDDNGIAVCTCDRGTLNADGKNCIGDGDCSPKNWDGYDGETCGPCSALVNIEDFYEKTCSSFCRMNNLRCVDSWDDDEDDTCSLSAEKRGCDHMWSGTSDAICQCSDVETCDDGIKNKDEDNVDCGGSCSNACGECQDDANPIPSTCTNAKEGECPADIESPFWGSSAPSCFELNAKDSCDLPWADFQNCDDSTAGQVKDNCKRSCNNCQGDCEWSDWGTWTSCSGSCGFGTRDRSRVEATAATNGGAPCTGDPTQTEPCTSPSCPVEAPCCTMWSAECFTESNANNNNHACTQCGSACESECNNPASDDCKNCCVAHVHDTPWNCPVPDICGSSLCLNGGTCLNPDDNNAECACVDGYSGQKCEISEGKCVDEDDDFQYDTEGSGCDVYEAYEGHCGTADDEDFTAAELCCSCGGGYRITPPDLIIV